MGTALVASLAVVAALTLGATGGGDWAWGDPGSELRWYAGALHSPATATQLTGNLLLLAPSAVLAVLLRPGLARPTRLAPLVLAAGAAIEVLQWALPLGRVVSPVDALLNAAGGLVAGLLTGAFLRLRRAGSGGLPRVWAGA